MDLALPLLTERPLDLPANARGNLRENRKLLATADEVNPVLDRRAQLWRKFNQRRRQRYSSIDCEAIRQSKRNRQVRPRQECGELKVTLGHLR